MSRELTNPIDLSVVNTILATQDDIANLATQTALDSLSSDVVTIQTDLNKRVRVDTNQTFSNTEKTQARSNINSASSGPNSDITSLSGLTTALSVSQGGTGATTSIAALNNLASDSIRNRHFNSAMQISQDLDIGSTKDLASNGYALDGVYVLSSGSVLRCSRQLFTSSVGSPYKFNASVNTSDSSITSSDVYAIRFHIEGSDIADLNFGSVNSKNFTWRASVTLPTGTYGVSFHNNGFDRSYVTTFTINAEESNIEKIISIVVPVDQTGTWISDSSGVGISVSICLAAGSNYQTSTVNSWQTGYFMTTSSQTNLMSSTSNSIKITDIGFYENTILPQWRMPNYIDDLKKCQRYYWKSKNPIQTYSINNLENSRSAIVHYPVEMRSVPSITGSTIKGNLDTRVINSKTTCSPIVTNVSNNDVILIDDLTANARF